MCVCVCVCVYIYIYIYIYLIQADVMILPILFIILRNLLRAFPDFNTFSRMLTYADVQDDVMSKIRKSSGANYDLGSNAQVQ